jgi:hypothetical protein
MGFLRSSVRHKGMLQRFIFANFSKDRYQRAQYKRDFGNYCRPGDPLEKRIEIQVSSVDLREAVCLYGREFRRWTIAELVERLKNLGVCASRASVTKMRELLAVVDGYRESAQSWRELLQQLKRMGLPPHRSWPSATVRLDPGSPCRKNMAR